MDQIAFITGADRGLGLALAARLLGKGWIVFAGQYMPAWPDLAALQAQYPACLHLIPLDVASEESVQAAAKLVAEKTDRVDLLINNAGVLSAADQRGVREPRDFDDMLRVYNVNTLGPLRVVDAFLPLMESSAMKRLCFVSSEAGSINRCWRKGLYGYCMSKTALNMGVSILFNRLRPQGYTFRLYHPGWMRSYMNGVKNPEADLEPEEAAIPAVAYFLRERGGSPQTLSRHDDNRLVLRDYLGQEWPW